MVVKIEKWGKSQGLKLTKRVLKTAEIDVGDDIEVIAGKRQIVLRKSAKPKFDLREMLSRMPRGYKPREESFGKPVGKEEW